MRKFSREIKKVVIKVGSSSITHDNGKINLQKIDELCFEIANLKNKGMDVILVSSGAIAAGRAKLNLSERPKETSVKQAAAAVGQVALTNIYDRSLISYGYNSAQILLTRQIEKDDEMRENAKNTFEKLQGMNAIPIINENDTISTYEIKFGDNDTLSAIISRITEADLLIMLTDIEGLYTDDPRKNKDAKIIHQVDNINDVEGMAKETESNVGTGGMYTKIKAAKLAIEKNIQVVIASGENMKTIRDIVKGEEIGTYFKC
ncbi:MAG: glutamate 5-kinase [Peptoniphilus harei]|nr:glutamate 5-kinase [Peptoniphilus harei]MDU1663062.1 glutamate 5-kinase [Peptoniphilus harei]MDU3009478.1 glutamate 5-kinase [Peptoniphilus harei]